MIADLTAEIKIELRKFTNLIKKKCNFCSTIERNIFSYEQENVQYFVCSTCIIKLALNNLRERKLPATSSTNIHIKHELQTLVNYITSIINEIQDS